MKSAHCLSTTSHVRNLSVLHSDRLSSVLNALNNLPCDRMNVPRFFQHSTTLKNTLASVRIYQPGNYLHEQFVSLLSNYANQRKALSEYFTETRDLNALCKDYIQFCFQREIVLDKAQTLDAFEHHNVLSERAVKAELLALKPKDTMHILGFGLGNGHFEQSIAQYLIEQGIAHSVTVYGIDPFAEPIEGITLLPAELLLSNEVPLFDVITARWVLHHVALQQRWHHFIHALNHTEIEALVLIVEHGFVSNQQLVIDKKLYDLLSALFDVTANIGLRPEWFTETAFDLGANFFIHYLSEKDFSHFKTGLTVPMEQAVYDVGPTFPNQTVCCMKRFRL